MSVIGIPISLYHLGTSSSQRFRGLPLGRRPSGWITSALLWGAVGAILLTCDHHLVLFLFAVCSAGCMFTRRLISSFLILSILVFPAAFLRHPISVVVNSYFINNYKVVLFITVCNNFVLVTWKLFSCLNIFKWFLSTFLLLFEVASSFVIVTPVIRCGHIVTYFAVRLCSTSDLPSLPIKRKFSEHKNLPPFFCQKDEDLPLIFHNMLEGLVVLSYYFNNVLLVSDVFLSRSCLSLVPTC